MTFAELRKKARSWGGVAARGFAMGAADVVPGVSGGTMALITGIYEVLIAALRRFTEARFLEPLLRLRIREASRVVHWGFLLPLFAGILAAVVSLAPLLEWLLEHHPIRLWAFFFGLILASIFTVSGRLPAWGPSHVVAAVLGAAVAFIVVGLVPVSTPENALFVLLAGVIAISAMVLPGISGSFMLVLLGKYQYVLAALNDRDLRILVPFVVGLVIGITLFARFLSWVLARQHDLTIAALIGVMAGSLRKIWPWKETIETTVDRHGDVIPLVERAVLPARDSELFVAVLLAAAGLAAVLVLDRLARRREPQV